MTHSTYFVQPCPTCGRMLEIRVKYLGRDLTCRHCQGEFEACDPTSNFYPPETSALNLLRRANELLDSSE